MVVWLCGRPTCWTPTATWWCLLTPLSRFPVIATLMFTRALLVGRACVVCLWHSFLWMCVKCLCCAPWLQFRQWHIWGVHSAMASFLLKFLFFIYNLLHHYMVSPHDGHNLDIRMWGHRVVRKTAIFPRPASFMEFNRGKRQIWSWEELESYECILTFYSHWPGSCIWLGVRLF